MNWKALLEGIAAAAIGGAATGGATAISDGTFHPKQVGSAAAAGAIIGVAAYLKQSPLKPKPKPQPQQSDPPPDPGPQG